MSVLESLQKVSDVEDQILVGAVRVSRNVATGVEILKAIRQANLGDDANAVLDKLVEIAEKAQQIVGSR